MDRSRETMERWRYATCSIVRLKLKQFVGRRGLVYLSIRSGCGKSFRMNQATSRSCAMTCLKLDFIKASTSNNQCSAEGTFFLGELLLKWLIYILDRSFVFGRVGYGLKAIGHAAILTSNGERIVARR